MSKPRIPFLREMHDYMLTTRTRLTAERAEAIFGCPKGGMTIEGLFANGAKAGWFTVEQTGNGSVYTAKQRGETKPRYSIAWSGLDALSGRSIFEVKA